MVKCLLQSLVWGAAIFGCMICHAQPAKSIEQQRIEALWKSYLQPQAAWPKRPEEATADLAPLPDPVSLRAQLNDNLIKLGEKLFHDPRLSTTGKVSCASCHLSENAFADPRQVSIGVHQQQGRRNAPGLINTHLWKTFFWDGRASSLEEQAAMPVRDPVEMAHETNIIVTMVGKSDDYQPLLIPFKDTPDSVDWSLLAKALAEFQRTLMDDPTTQPLDRFLLAVASRDWKQARASLSDQQLVGLHLFRTKAGCVKCHNGPLLSDQRFHNTGLHYFGRKFEDLGRFEVTGRNIDMGSFRTPSLRHLLKSKPWMHNGLFTQLEGVVRMYEHGGARPRRPENLSANQHYPQTTDLLTPFELSDSERKALLEFITSL
ncbi:cytochrome-c peroxidase [Idiomarina aminovorans]|uniref:cytochrome-c peroxidase n=1 Tax=Idiomarina aminovorans TaxID=2914829 RepID=UPI0020041B30|nr:cytochrome c peroxidase [Idiomarina sp. ATCH4]MCK7458848.1 cytochrome-c peroxidase [Idiomarina sp. ATCH4]